MPRAAVVAVWVALLAASLCASASGALSLGFKDVKTVPGNMCHENCNGHGKCVSTGSGPTCQCDLGWGSEFDITEWRSPSCARRSCPAGEAWGMAAMNRGNDNTMTAHELRECSNVGLCDHDTGKCSCPTGYAGEACQRSTCPNDCSGHGRCLSMRRLAHTEAAFPLSYHNSTIVAATTAAVVYITVTTAGSGYATSDVLEIAANALGGTHTAVKFTLTDGDHAAGALSTDADALLAEIQATGVTTNSIGTNNPSDLPLGVHSSIALTDINSGSGTGAVVTVGVTSHAEVGDSFGTFAGYTGFGNDTYINPAWEADKVFGCLCDSIWEVGLTAGTTQASQWFGPDCSQQRCPSAPDPETTDVDETDCRGVAPDADLPGQIGMVGNKCHVDCANRGVCDFSTGNCKCFRGYYGLDCTLKSALSAGTGGFVPVNDDRTLGIRSRNRVDSLGRGVDDAGNYFNDDL